MAVTELRSLRISPELDPSKYVSGAQQIDAADKMMVAGKQAAGAAFSATDAKISASGDVLARLSRQYVDGYASAQRMQAAVNSLSRGIETGKITMAQATPILEGIFRKYGQLGDGAQFAAKGQNEFAAAITATNAKLTAQVAAANAASASVTRVRPAANQNFYDGVRGFNQFNTANVAAQFQDIGVTAAMGMSPVQIALQQGTQLQAVLGPMGAAGAAKALGTAFLSLITPVSLVTLALVGGTAAAIQYFMKSREETKTLDDALKAHEAQIKRIEDGWGKAASAEQKYGKQSASAAAFGLEMSTAELRSQLRKQVPDVLSAITSATSDNISKIGGARAFRGTTLFGLLGGEIDDLIKKAKDGEPDIIGLTRRIEELGSASDNKGIRVLARDVSDAIRPIEDLARKLLEANNQLQKFRDAMGPHGLPLRRGMFSTEDMGSLDQFNAAEGVSADRRRQANEAQLQGIFARSPEERAAAARAAAGAQYNDESAEARRDRIETAGKLALAEANHTLSESQKDRARSLDQTLASQQLDLALIGKTTGEAAQMRFEFERIQALREDAARNGVAVDEQELALIKAKAEAYGKYADAIARANLNRDLDFERSQLFLSPQEQQIASRLRGTGLGADSAEAQKMRDNQKFADGKELATGFLNDFRAEMIDSGGNIGKAMGRSILNALSNAMDKAWANIADQLATSLVSALTGQKSGGGVGASAFGAVGGFAEMIFGKASNDNYAPGSVTRAPLGALGGGSVAEQSWNFFKSKGLADHQVAGILGNIKAESAFNPSAIGDAGKAFGLFQHHGARGGGQGLMASGAAGQLDHAWKELQTSESASLSRLMSSKDVRGATAAFAGFERPSGYSVANPEGAHNFAGRLNGAEQALKKFGGGVDKMTTGATNAAKGLDNLGSGMGKMGNALSQFPSAPTGGGGGGLLGSLIGGLSSAFSGTKAFSWLSANPGGSIGLYADGTENAPDGWAWVGERGPELKKLRAGDVIRSNPTSMQMAANANRARGGSGSRDVVHLILQDDSGRMASIADQQIQTRSGTIVQVSVQQSVKAVKGQMSGLMANAQSRQM